LYLIVQISSTFNMWLLNARTLELHEFIGNNVPPYAILSHVWGPEEVSFAEMKKAKHREAAKKKIGFSKIEGCCAQVVRDGHEWAWVDSCCIDKRSSAELSEAINSMWTWYADSRRCYVYLADVTSTATASEELKNSRWFTRGWTLQELIAPRDSVFFTRDWNPVGQLIFEISAPFLRPQFSYANITEQVSTITGIPAKILTGEKSVYQACVAQRMFWASRRETTRPEDRAYSLMGIFNISMPILYGEGLYKAFQRLQGEIIAKLSDQSILAWYRSDSPLHDHAQNLLAQSPEDFRNSGSVIIKPSFSPLDYLSPFSIANIGLKITLRMPNNRQLPPVDERVKVLLDCTLDRADAKHDRGLCLTLTRLCYDPEGCPIFMCTRLMQWDLQPNKDELWDFRSMYITLLDKPWHMKN
jgi:hypothetical protein